jgi:hypothetical protein
MENTEKDLEKDQPQKLNIKRKNTEIGNEEELDKLCNSYVKFVKSNTGNKYRKENDESRNTNYTSRTK